MKTTQKRFWEILAGGKGKFRFDEEGSIRQKRTGACPITYVGCQVTGSRNCDPSHYSAMADEIGLGTVFADMVVNAADDMSAHSMSVRSKLLKVLGLKER